MGIGAWPALAGEPSRQQVAALLQHAYQWTRVAAKAAPPVARQVAPALTFAAQLYEAQEYPAAFSQLAGVATTVQQARRTYPALPEL